MASLVFTSMLEDWARGAIDFDTDSFKGMLCTATYSPNKDTHTKRSDVTNEVANGNGYTTGGATVTCTVAKNTSTDQVTLTFSNPSWPTATFTARYMVIYKSRGGASSADELVAVVDFTSDVTSTGGTFAVTISSPITLQN